MERRKGYWGPPVTLMGFWLLGSREEAKPHGVDQKPWGLWIGCDNVPCPFTAGQHGASDSPLLSHFLQAGIIVSSSGCCKD